MATIKLISSDGQEFILEAQVARLSSTIQELYEFDPTNLKPIPLWNVHSTTFSLVVEWAMKQYEKMLANNHFRLGYSEWAQQFLARNRNSLLDLVHASHYLKLEMLMNAATDAVLVAAFPPGNGNASPFTNEQLNLLPHDALLPSLLRQSNELLFRAQEISPRWDGLCRQVAHQRTSLTFIVGHPPEGIPEQSYSRPWDDRIFDRFAIDSPADDWAAATAHWTPDLFDAIHFQYGVTGTDLSDLTRFITKVRQFFPAITQLVLALFTGEPLDTFYSCSSLLAGYQQQLVSFKLYADYGREPSFWERETVENMDAFKVHERLIALLNSMPVLSKLLLHCKGALFRPRQHINLPILEQLASFSLFTYGALPYLSCEVRWRGAKNWEKNAPRRLRLRLTSQPPMKHFWLGYDFFPLRYRFQAVHRILLRSIVQFSVCLDGSFYRIQQLANLEFLHVQFPEPAVYSWLEFLTILKPLTELEALHLQLPYHHLRAIAPSAQGPVFLRRINFLQITFDFGVGSVGGDKQIFIDHQMLEALQLDLNFPSLRKVFIDCTLLPARCVHCLKTAPNRVESCLRRLVAMLRRCRNIEHIYVSKGAGFRRIGPDMRKESFEAFGIFDANWRFP